ncbi:MAG TPA: Nramp family divalent metal transporter [Candidatus Saccharimonadales bacterium]|nr:Nramp family divalent metal transporter [Candidatus Saccharimonadales bacterium]
MADCNYAEMPNEMKNKANSTSNQKTAEQFQQAIVTKTVEAPAVALDKTIKTTHDIGRRLNNDKTIKKGRDYWRNLGPGLTTGASDDDPSGIATYSQAGAQFGFHMLWLAAFTFPLMSVVQEMCARIGLVTGRGLAGNIRKVYSRRMLNICAILLFGANAFNIGADLGAMAQGVKLIFPHSSTSLLLVGFTILMIGLQIFTPYERYAKYLKWLAMVLLAYILSAILAHLNWPDVLKHSVVPSITFSKESILLICAILGTTISPYLFFWQTSQEIEDKIIQGKTTIASRQEEVSKPEMHSMRVDVWTGMLLSNLVMFFIIATCGALLFSHGIHNITSAAQAAEALRPFAGSSTYTLFAIGIVGTGMLAIPVLAGSSSYAIAEALKKQGSLSKKLKQAYAFYGVIIISMLVGLAINFIGINPIKALIYAAVANGIVAPVVLVFILLISSNKDIMGKWVNKPLTSILGWLITIIMAVAGVAAIFTLF